MTNMGKKEKNATPLSTACSGLGDGGGGANETWPPVHTRPLSSVAAIPLRLFAK